jgi:hypothetical protein
MSGFDGRVRADAGDGAGKARGWRERLRLPRLRNVKGRTWKWIAIVLVVLLLLYYPIGMALMHTIDDNPGFAPPAPAPGGSKAVAMMAGLIDREVDVHPWTANDPFFMPSALLDNMPNYQQGMMYAMSRFAIELGDQIGRLRGTSQVDPDLDNAAGLLKYPGTRWIWNPDVSWFVPTATSEQQYRSARDSLLRYNNRLAEGDAVFDRRADNLLATLERIAADLGSSSQANERKIATRPWLGIDTEADDVFYSTKGRLYAYYMILKALGEDFSEIIGERDLKPIWDRMLESLRDAALVQPAVVINGAPDAQFMPSHLAAQGFYLLRARIQLREISNILLK